MVLKTITHKTSGQYAEIHYNRRDESFIARFYTKDKVFLKEHEFPVVSLSEVEDELHLWATI